MGEKAVSDESAGPLVSIGIPTRNRAARLIEALDSARAQTYRRLEIVVSDNASTDATATACEEAQRAEPRLRVIRQPENIGLSRNFNAVLTAARGDYFLWLSDDDRLSPEYVERCLKALLQDPNTAVAVGRARYIKDGRYFYTSSATNLLDDVPARRVLRYFRTVSDNPGVFGVMPRSLPLGIRGFGNTLGDDWLFLSSLAFLGKVRTVEDAWIERSMGGASRSFRDLARAYGLGGIAVWNPYLHVAVRTFAHIAFEAPVFEPMSGWARVVLAARASAVILRRFAVIGFITHPALAQLRIRPRLRAWWGEVRTGRSRGGGEVAPRD